MVVDAEGDEPKRAAGLSAVLSTQPRFRRAVLILHEGAVTALVMARLFRRRRCGLLPLQYHPRDAPEVPRARRGSDCGNPARR